MGEQCFLTSIPPPGRTKGSARGCPALWCSSLPWRKSGSQRSEDKTSSISKSRKGPLFLLPPPPPVPLRRPARSELPLRQHRRGLLPAAIVSLYRDLISQEDMFSSTYDTGRWWTGCAWRGRGRWSAGHRVTSATRLRRRPRRRRDGKHSSRGCRYCPDPSFARNQLQEAHQGLREINQRET